MALHAVLDPSLPFLGIFKYGTEVLFSMAGTTVTHYVQTPCFLLSLALTGCGVMFLSGVTLSLHSLRQRMCVHPDSSFPSFPFPSLIPLTRIKMVLPGGAARQVPGIKHSCKTLADFKCSALTLSEFF